MSTARRRITGGTRRPQVAGRPRSAATGSESDAATTEGTLAVEERSDARTDARPAADTGRTGSRLRTRTVARPGARPDESAEATDTTDTTDRTEATGATATAAPVRTDEDVDDAGSDATALPAAPAVRSGETGGEPSRPGLGARLRRIPLPAAPATRKGTAALLAVTLLLTAAAAFFAISWARLEFSGSSANTALSDVGTTATVSEQVGEAVTKVYSFDFARLDQAESDARGVITGPFTGQFDQIFGNVRQLAPKQQAVVTATIPKSAVQSIDGDRATVYVFVNQVVRRVDDGGKPQQGTAAARLRVDAEYVDGRWKISGMTPA